MKQQKTYLGYAKQQGKSQSEDNQADDFQIMKVLGKGTFGTVFLAHWKSKNINVALKTVSNNPKFKNREVQILSSLSHPSIVPLLTFYETRDEQKKKSYNNIVMEHLPTTLATLIRRKDESLLSEDPVCIVNISKKMLEALAFLDEKGICHRDIKPSNILINELTQQVKLCDFGSSKEMKEGQKSIVYICSRYYRAPELILECSSYGTKIDVWALGCVIAEMISGRPLFAGLNNTDQLVKIIKVIGSPSPEDLKSMKVPQSKGNFITMMGCGIEHKFMNLSNNHLQQLVNVLSKIFVHDPSKRLSAKQALTFDIFQK